MYKVIPLSKVEVASGKGSCVGEAVFKRAWLAAFVHLKEFSCDLVRVLIVKFILRKLQVNVAKEENGAEGVC